MFWQKLKWRRHGVYLLLFLLGLLIAAVVLTQLRSHPILRPALDPLPQHPQIAVHMNHSQAHSYQEPYRPYTREGEDLEAIMIEQIAKAQKTIDVAVQEFRLPNLAKALVARQQAGVRVRVVMENTYTAPWATYSPAQVSAMDPRMRERYNAWKALVDTNGDGQLSAAELSDRDVQTILNEAKIPWIDDTADGSKGSMLMHHKFIVIDNRQVIATTANFTLSDVHGDLGRPDTRGNANSLLVIDSPAVARLFTEEFNIMWGDGPGGQPNSRFGVKKPVRPPQRVAVGDAMVTVRFSPTPRSQPWAASTNGLIGQTLNRSRQKIDMALFVFSDQELSYVLEERHNQGVKIRALIDSGFIYRDFSEALDMMGVAMANTAQARQGNCYYEAGNRPWQKPIQTVGTPLLPEGDKLHHKYGVVDDRTVIVGSHNWSEAANRGNDEFLLVIEHPTVAAHYEREFERLYSNSRLGLPQHIRDRIQQQLTACGGKIATRPAPSSGNRASTPTTRVNLNTATAEELQTLPGVGPKLAAEIIRAREQKPFQSLADLDAVPGVGPKLLERLRDRVTW
ncbi:phospholipase D-like domain-containing protein [Thermosynechococcus sp. GLH187]|uniref:phospholipase D-like domain-containing protein n=1 Tax=unclassified Thermosynechococcus TaxID=2622553 RepID=UPI00287753F7|nr:MULTISPECIES: phospholipase D-like domain-containing protein [unclassified Thermosynechococcus]WNC44740.1 phospholipase D-like domain-containing protein [Thermosynechococcus sp. GLH187]WNC47276.1 phospholipase D-like domain-containing protein [Thermosynechococcus sp. GLH333]WNC49813.1 phospholipase D-like domain-containing protein [Thermosynechococcus sp. GLH87]